MDLYTHTFEFKIGDGGKFLTGDIEFDTDNKVSYRFKTFSEPINEDTLAYFTELGQLCKKIFHESGGIKMIRIKENI
jgi:hypothetical protein